MSEMVCWASRTLKFRFRLKFRFMFNSVAGTTYQKAVLFCKNSTKHTRHTRDSIGMQTYSPILSLTKLFRTLATFFYALIFLFIYTTLSGNDRAEQSLSIAVWASAYAIKHRTSNYTFVKASALALCSLFKGRQ